MSETPVPQAAQASRPAPDAEPKRDAAAAFEEMRNTLLTLDYAIKGLLAAQADAPDYNISFARIEERLHAVHLRLGKVEQSPAVALSPAAMTSEIN